MTSPKLVFYLTCLFFGKIVHTADPKLPSSSASEIIQPGGSVTLNCTVHTGSFDGEHSLYWFKHSEDSPGLIHTHGGRNDQCTTISVTGSGLNIPASVHQSASEIIQSGDSVTLNCTVHTGSCDGEHSVYWFKNSEDSPGLLYTRGGRNDQYEVDSLVYFLSGALAFNSILVVLLAFLVYTMKKRNNCQSTESEARLSTPSTENAEGYQDAGSLHYAAVSVNVPNRSRRQRNIPNDECVYSGVKL
ncbi:hypothetical protein JOQ06_020682 [Pogonophryne albipinna]|uniref:Ig-like domain-containing protein n=1 Tax=Pogonophryne albipinna TaxID=1090488 RepID=A0AAD6BRJ0_9TELE|nr:hypothetical protein JOQ06_020682 [Pogonophryne albipinna]